MQHFIQLTQHTQITTRIDNGTDNAGFTQDIRCTVNCKAFGNATEVHAGRSLQAHAMIRQQNQVGDAGCSIRFEQNLPRQETPFQQLRADAAIK